MKKLWIVFAIMAALVFLCVFAVDFYRARLVRIEETKLSDPARRIEEPSVDVVPVDLNPQEPAEKEIPKDKSRFARAGVLISGDLMVHENVLKDCAVSENESFENGFDFAPLFSEVKSAIEKADYAVATGCGPYGANDAPAALSGYPLFNTPTAFLKALYQVGFDTVNIASDHMLDMGAVGLKNGVRVIRSQNLDVLGAYLNEEEFEDVSSSIREIEGVRIAFLSYTAETNVSDLNPGAFVPYFCVGKTAIKKAMIEKQIKKARQEADFVVVLLGFGSSGSFETDGFQKEAAAFLADAGADVIVGNGKRLIQKIERLESAEGKESIAVYSLGTMLSTMQYTDNLLGGYLTLDFVVNGDKKSVENLLFTPTVVHYDKAVRNVRIVPLETYSADRFQTHGSVLLYGEVDYSRFSFLINEFIPNEFLPAKFRK